MRQTTLLSFFEQDVCWSEAAAMKPGFSIKEIIPQQSTSPDPLPYQRLHFV